MAFLSYIFGDRNDINIGVQNTLESSLNSFCQNLIIWNNSNGFHVTINPGEYVWGCNSAIMNNSLILILAYEKLQNEIYLRTAHNQLNYILGCNAHNISFVTGIGQKRPMFPHHRPSGSDGIVEPIPGLMVGGPDQYLSDPLLQANFTSTTPPALCYIDDEGSYASNEIAINWNAPLVFVSGYFAGISVTTIDHGKRSDPYPENFQLQQNYPNPFNSNCRIEFSLYKNMRVRLDLYDVQGRLVKTLINDELADGSHSILLDAENLSSGIYWYELSTQFGNRSKKMVLIK
jgi:endoglucanase